MGIERQQIARWIERVRLSSDDDGALFLLDKLLAGSNISFTIKNSGGNEVLKISATDNDTDTRIDIEEDGVVIVSDATSLNFGAGQFFVDNPTGSEVDVKVDTDAIGTDELASQAVTPTEVDGSGGTADQVLITDGTASGVSWSDVSGSGAATLTEEKHLEPGTLTIANNSTDSDHDIDVTGGAVGVHDFSDNWIVVDAPSETPALQIDTTGEGGRINSSSKDADTWYECAVIYDSTNDTVGYGMYKDADRPTAASDLPGDYDYIREMGAEANWWVRTNGNYNFRQYRHFYSNDWVYNWTAQELTNIGQALNTSSPDTDLSNTTAVDISSFMPPQRKNITLPHVRIETGSESNTATLWLNSHQFDGAIQSSGTNSDALVQFESALRNSFQVQLPGCENQEFYYVGNDISDLIIVGPNEWW